VGDAVGVAVVCQRLNWTWMQSALPPHTLHTHAHAHTLSLVCDIHGIAISRVKHA
jgi:hypothetical protein